MEIVTKKCEGCRQTKPTTEFETSTRSRDGLTTRCIMCQRITSEPEKNLKRSRADVITDWLDLADKATGPDRERLLRLAISLAACPPDGPIRTIRLPRREPL